jgi:NADH dehydrogenase (ubiquinone) 1 alpha/beta subcomplex 1
MAMAAARRALLNHLRVPVGRPATAAAAAGAAAGSVPVARLLSSTTEVEKGSFLDKGEVADRVVSVIKNFQKVEPSKVSAIQCARVARTSGRWIYGYGFCSV